MKKRIIIFLIFAILIVIGCTYLMKMNNEYLEANMKQESSNNGITIKNAEPVDKGPKNQNKEKIEEQIQNTEKVFLYFYADWCPMCQKTTPMVDEFIAQHPDISIIKIDTDIEVKLKEQFNVHNVPTIILVEKNIEIERIIEITEKEKIEEFLQK